MDNKFYYKTPAALLMMLAGGTTVAHAAEHTQVTPEKHRRMSHLHHQQRMYKRLRHRLHSSQHQHKLFLSRLRKLL